MQESPENGLVSKFPGSTVAQKEKTALSTSRSLSSEFRLKDERWQSPSAGVKEGNEIILRIFSVSRHCFGFILSPVNFSIILISSPHLLAEWLNFFPCLFLSILEEKYYSMYATDCRDNKITCIRCLSGSVSLQPPLSCPSPRLCPPPYPSWRLFILVQLYAL